MWLKVAREGLREAPRVEDAKDGVDTFSAGT